MTIGPLARTAATLKALAHPARLRLLAMLRTGGLCVCQAAAALIRQDAGVVKRCERCCRPISAPPGLNLRRFGLETVRSERMGL
jgi:DNA-binding transcriptional ArsR family regulator